MPREISQEAGAAGKVKYCDASDNCFRWVGSVALLGEQGLQR